MPRRPVQQGQYLQLTLWCVHEAAQAASLRAAASLLSPGHCLETVLWCCRYTLNWLKLRAWELQEWDAIVLLDADVTVLGDLTHIFSLPTDFAAVLDNGKTVHR